MSSPAWLFGRRAARPGTPATQGLLAEAGARAWWAVLWLLMAALWLLPANSSPNAIERAARAAPAGTRWLAAVHQSVGAAAAGRGLGIAIVLALLSAVIGVGVLVGRLERPLLGIASVVALAYWVIGEGFGGVFTGQATDPNTGPLLILLGASLYPSSRDRRQRRGRRRTVDDGAISMSEPGASLGCSAGAALLTRAHQARRAPVARGGG